MVTSQPSLPGAKSEATLRMRLELSYGPARLERLERLETADGVVNNYGILRSKLGVIHQDCYRC